MHTIFSNNYNGKILDLDRKKILNFSTRVSKQKKAVCLNQFGANSTENYSTWKNKIK